MRTIAVLVPVLRRPGHVQPLVESFITATSTDDARMYFIAQQSDQEEIAAINDAVRKHPTHVSYLLVADEDQSWSRKINRGYAQTFEPWMLLGADDLRFRSNWVEAARPYLAWWQGIVGTNDLGNPGTMRGSHSTHPLVSRAYADNQGTIEGSGKICHEEYIHNFVDAEIVATARARGLYVHAKDCVIEHLHPAWRKAPDDSTYALGRASFNEDEARFMNRKTKYGWAVSYEPAPTASPSVASPILSPGFAHPYPTHTSTAKRICFFAHYDATGVVRPYIWNVLRHLHAVCDEIAFISTANLNAHELEKVKPFCLRAAARPNAGYDFGMWRDAILATDITRCDEVVLTNSSFFGPTEPLHKLFDRMKDDPCDAWGLTDNMSIAWHLQSYFMVLRKPLLSRLQGWFEGVQYHADKWQVIHEYEVGLSQWMLNQGLQIKSVASVIGNLSSARGSMNPSVTHPVEMLSMGVPFVKAELLRDNPANIDVGPILAALYQSGYDRSFLDFDRPVKANAATKERIDAAWRQGQR